MQVLALQTIQPILQTLTVLYETQTALHVQIMEQLLLAQAEMQGSFFTTVCDTILVLTLLLQLIRVEQIVSHAIVVELLVLQHLRTVLHAQVPLICTTTSVLRVQPLMLQLLMCVRHARIIVPHVLEQRVIVQPALAHTQSYM